MSELSSALFSIADDNEFRFARLCFAFTCSIPVWHLLLSGSLHLFLTFVSAVYGTESDDRRHNVQHKDKVQYRQGNCCPHGQLFFTARPDAAAPVSYTHLFIPNNKYQIHLRLCITTFSSFPLL